MRNHLSGFVVLCSILVAIAVALIAPNAAVAIVGGLGIFLLALKNALYLFPFIVYLVFGLYVFYRGRLFEVLRDEVQEELQKQQMASLTLAGFAFTSLGLLLSFFKDEIKIGASGPQEILKFFGVALGSFVFSYMVLRYRGRRIFSLLSDASIDNGLWCILIGLWQFSAKTPGLGGLPVVFEFVILGFLAHLVLNFCYYVKLLR